MNTRALIVLVLGGLSFLLLFLWLQPVAEKDSQPVDGVQMNVPAKAETRLPVQKVIAIGIEDGRRVSGPEIIRVKQGETLALEIVSNQDAELHLHGYDHRLSLKAGMPLQHSFVAKHSGRFEYELHGHGAHHALGVIEVLPQ